MRERFTIHEQVCFQEFKRRVQGPRESLTEIATALELLSISAFRTTPKSYVADLLKNQFIDGLRHTELMKLVVSGQHSSIKTALAAAQDIQARSDRQRSRQIFTIGSLDNNMKADVNKEFLTNASNVLENFFLPTSRSEGRVDSTN